MATSPAQMANEISSLRSDLLFFRRSTKFKDDPVGLMVEFNGRVTRLMDLARDLPTLIGDQVRLSLEDLRRWLMVESLEAAYDRARTNEFAVAVRNGIAKTSDVFKDRLEQLSLKLAVWLPQQPMLEPPPTSGVGHGAGERGKSEGEPLTTLRDCDRKAGRQYDKAIDHAAERERELLTYDAAYDHYCEYLKDEGEKIPRRDSWKKYVSNFLKAAGRPKYPKGGGVETRSVVRSKSKNRTKTDRL